MSRAMPGVPDIKLIRTDTHFKNECLRRDSKRVYPQDPGRNAQSRGGVLRLSGKPERIVLYSYEVIRVVKY